MQRNRRINVLKEPEKELFERALDTLKKKVGSNVNYNVISEHEKSLHFSRRTEQDNYIYEEEYSKAIRRKDKLVQQFKGRTLEEVIPGCIISNEHGECYCITNESDTRIVRASYAKSREVILSDLKLLSGVGPVREKKLKGQGFQTIEDLTRHPLWRESAIEILRMVDTREVQHLQSTLGRRLPKSHPLAHYLAGFCRTEDFAIIDIETMGLFGRPIILLGIAKQQGDKMRINQFLLRDISDEASALWELINHLDKNSAFITFNGRAFDIPYIQERLAFYGIRSSLNNPHFDALHFTRRAYRNRLANCRLETVEKHYGVNREVDVPGALIPEFYESYLRTQNVGPLIAIVEHNKQDLITLANIFS